MLTQEFFLSAGEVNAEGELSLPLLTSKIIDIATLDSNNLGVGNPSMEHLNLGWVLSRLTIEMKEYPKVNHKYRLTTWIEDWNRHFSVRCFSVSHENGRILGFGRSIWMVMDTLNHSNAGLSHLQLPANEKIGGFECPIERQQKHLHIPENLIFDHYRFKYCDIDFYRHVNTVRYVSIILNEFELNEMDNNMVKRMELSFLHEGRYGSEVEIRRNTKSFSGNSIYEFMIYDSEQEKEILYSRVWLQKR